LDEKSHYCIMIGYSKYSKVYQLFDLIKWKIIIKQNVWSDEKSFGINLLNSSSRFLQDDSLDVFSDIGALVSYFSPFIGKSNFLHVPTRLSTYESTIPSSFISTSVLTEDPTTSNQLAHMN